ncbi:hypothetical protein BX600DRAFT_508270 [Xylariales sp. PMI_506]|nr:hypothetical protein BX600DRAFT_508270 [Xylariales sp. PMI_506]
MDEAQSLIKNAPFHLTEEDKQALLGTLPDQPHTWEGARELIEAGEMGSLRRSAADLRNYLVWTADIGRQYGSVAEFVRREKLRWKLPATAKDQAIFGDPSDFKVIRNDWPYAFAPGITHLVIWFKARIDLDPATGLPAAEAHRVIDEYLRTTFRRDLGCSEEEDNIQWFKQKSNAQSVRALEHIHVLVRGVDDDRITDVTGESIDEICCNLVMQEAN